jgi:hypothetical protein
VRKVIHIIVAVSLAVGMVSPGALAQETVKEGSTDKHFPKTVSFKHDYKSYTLEVTGLSVRKKFFFKVYGIAHYMDKTGFEDYDAARGAALSDQYAKQITMDFSRDVEVEKIKNAYREGFEKNSSRSEQDEISTLVDQFIAYYAEDVEKNDQYILRWLPGGIVLATVGGEEMPPLESVAFARVLWRIWLGDHSIVDKNKLVKMAVEK